jgi:acetyl esterase/lipase
MVGRDYYVGTGGEKPKEFEMVKRSILKTVGTAFAVCVILMACSTGRPSSGLKQYDISIDYRNEFGGGGPARSTESPYGDNVLRNVSYGKDKLQKMDVYLPKNPKNSPVIFMVHGGAWIIGDKASGSVVKNKIARWNPAGFIVVSVNYRMLPGTDPLGQAGDVLTALAYAQAHASEWGGDPDKFILMGHSSGAHLAALIAAQPGRIKSAGGKPVLGAVLLDSAAYDVVHIMETHHYKLYDTAFGKDPSFWKKASPHHVMRVAIPPILAVCSTRRDESKAQAREFVEKAVALGTKAQVLEQNLSHRRINEDLGLPGDYTRVVETFMASLDPSVSAGLAQNGM